MKAHSHITHIRIETVAWNPRAFVYHNFLSEAEVDHLVRLGSQRVGRRGGSFWSVLPTHYNDI
jgi:prolyl 4-hydroxylase